MTAQHLPLDLVMTARLPLFFLGCCVVACAARPVPPAQSTPTPDSSATASSLVVTPDEALSVKDLFSRGEQHLREGRFERAAEDFERVVRAEPKGELAPQAWLKAAEARERQDQLKPAAAHLEQLARRFPKHPDTRTGLVRLIRLRAYLEQWSRAGNAATALLPVVDELPPLEQVVVYSGKGLALVFGGDPDTAEYFVEKGRNVVDSYELDRAGQLPRDLAALYFALGEIRRVRAERIQFVPRPTNFGVVLEERCQLLLDSQSAYSDTMRAYDAHWSAMAGYRVGELYQSLHDDLMAVPPPSVADTDRRRLLFEGAMRLRYSILLEKARTMMDHTLAMADRTGEASSWVERTRQARAAIDAAIERENAVIDELPFSRADLQAALDDLQERARKRETKGTE